MRVFYCDHHLVPLPEKHRFPMEKYARLRQRLVDEAILDETELHAASAAPVEVIAAVHERSYVDAFLGGTLDRDALRRIGFPWSPELVARVLASVGGTLDATEAALEDGLAGNLAGGTHHASAGAGSGYCVFNDIAVAARSLLDVGRVERVLVFDLDVHQGDGTAAIFREEPRVFTVSIHGARNFPSRKEESDLDVALLDETSDDVYLDAVRSALEEALERARPEILFYQAGVDPLAEDRLGRLGLSHAGLRARDELVLGRAHELGIPAVLTLGGGYAEPIEATLEAHANTYRAARQLV